MQQSRSIHYNIIEQLEREKHKLQQEIETVRQRRGTPAAPPSQPAGVGGSTTRRNNLYKVVLWIREANKISQHLNKNTVRFYGNKMQIIS